MSAIQDAIVRVREEEERYQRVTERRMRIIGYLWDHYLYYLEDAETFPELGNVSLGWGNTGLRLQFKISEKKEMRPVLQYMKTLPVFKIQKPTVDSRSYDISYWTELDDIEMICQELEMDFHWDSIWVTLEFWPREGASCALKRIGEKKVTYDQTVYSLECTRE